MYEEENEKERFRARRTVLAIKSFAKKQRKAPLIFGQILFLQVSTQTSKASPEASRNSRRSEVRAKNLQGEMRNGTKTRAGRTFKTLGINSSGRMTQQSPPSDFLQLLLVTAKEVTAICCVYVTAITRKK